MQTTKEIIEIVKFYKNGGDITITSGTVGIIQRPLWSFSGDFYIPYSHNFKVGDWVEIVYHREKPKRVGRTFKIYRFTDDGVAFTDQSMTLYDPNDINYCIIKPAKAPEPEYVEFTDKTFPEGLVFIKHKSWGKGYCLIAEFSQFSDKVGFGSGHIATYADLLEDEWLMSLDGCETWGVAGILK